MPEQATAHTAEPTGALAVALRERRFIITAEVTSPSMPNAASIRRRAGLLRGHVIAANVPDGHAVSAHVSALAAARLLLDEGLEPVLTLQCRDRNRLALQSDLLGAAALGIQNVLCLTGDTPPEGAGSPRTVFELDGRELVAVVRGLNNGNLVGDARPLPLLVPGVAAHPFGGVSRDPVADLVDKAAVGARFAQTQYIFDVPGFGAWMDRVRRTGVHERLAILASVGPLRSPRVLGFLTRLPGVRIPSAILARFDGLSESAFAEESLRLAAETIRAVAEIPGLAGVHVIAPFWEAKIPGLLTAAGVAERASRA